MNKRKKIFQLSQLFFAVLFAFYSIAQSKAQTIAATDNHLQYQGRVGFTDSAAKIYWAGSSVTIRFIGRELNVTLKDQRGHNYYNVIVDNNNPQILKTDTIKKSYNLVSNLTEGEHTVQLFKRTDAKAGMTLFYGFEIPATSRLIDLQKKKRSIEFYGNSITVGSGISEGKFPGGDENNYLSYAAVTARHFNANYTNIARSGIGLMVSWFSLIMKEMYNRLDPEDSTSKWDFKKYTPDLVVINLLQNDNSLVGMPDDDQFKKRFGNKAPTEEYITQTYSWFVKTIRSNYPNAHIICALGSMDAVRPGSPWPGYIKNAVASLHDSKIYTHFFKKINSDEHPNVKEQQEMADSLIQFIEQNIKW